LSKADVIRWFKMKAWHCLSVSLIRRHTRFCERYKYWTLMCKHFKGGKTCNSDMRLFVSRSAAGKKPVFSRYAHATRTCIFQVIFSQQLYCTLKHFHCIGRLNSAMRVSSASWTRQLMVPVPRIYWKRLWILRMPIIDTVQRWNYYLFVFTIVEMFCHNRKYISRRNSSEAWGIKSPELRRSLAPVRFWG